MGGFAERAKFSVYVWFSILYTALIYPVVGHWVWGGGWLAELGMQDFAGSTVVHLQGAIAALIATILLKPRKGRYVNNETVSIPGHNQIYSIMGVFVLWIGWFGFNAGSTLGSLTGFFGYVALTTNLAAAAGGIGALFLIWMINHHADLTTMINGVLAALVAITASCAFVEPWAAVVIGALAGATSVGVAAYMERKGIDDPIYAISVHGVPGISGTLSTGIFAAPHLVAQVGIGQAGLLYGGGLSQLVVQALGIAGTIIYVSIVSFILLYALKKTIGLRVSPHTEERGLDTTEHGQNAYPEMVTISTEPQTISGSYSKQNVGHKKTGYRTEVDPII